MVDFDAGVKVDGFLGLGSMKLRGDTGLVTLRVRDAGAEQLVYTFSQVTRAAEMMAFLRDFFPDAEFTLEPALH